MPYIANKPGTAFRTFTDKDTFSGDGSTTTFDMQFAIAEAGQNDLQIFVGGTLQIPGTDFTLGVDDAGDYKRITFTSAPASASNNIVILNPGTVEGELATVADNAITSGKLNVDAITGQTELAEAANNADTLLLHDTSASSLKKITVSNLTAQAGDGLAKSSSTLSVDANNATTLETSIAAGDFVLIYDASAGVLRKVSQTNFLNFPTVSSVSPTNVVSGDGTGNHTFVITGTGFTGATAKLLKSDNSTEISFDTVTVDSSTQITGVIAKSSLLDADEPFGVKISAASGLNSQLNQQITLDAQPIWSTASGSLATVTDETRSGLSYTVAAADPESGGDVTYTLESGSLPAGLSGSSTSSGYVISGNATAVGSDTTSNFTIRASDVNSNTSDRAFSITIQAPKVQVFTSSGTFSVPSGTTTVDVLVVAGGGAGGGQVGGGGGAGGLIFRPGFSVTPGGTVSVTVGDGGSAGGQTGQSGQNSVFGTLTAQGGGYGGGYSPGTAAQGGSGGGEGREPAGQFGNGTQPNAPGDSGTYGFGNDGGASYGTQWGGGGGGGAGAVGNNGAASQGGNGGIGRAYTISDNSTSVYYSGGGGGCADDPITPSNGSGGQGGGGNGGTNSGGGVPGQAGTANRGGGGGGTRDYPNPYTGHPGGKGIVIVRWS